MNFNHGVYLQPSLAEKGSFFPVKLFGPNPNDSISQNKARSHLLSRGHTGHAHFYSIFLTIEQYLNKPYSKDCEQN